MPDDGLPNAYQRKRASRRQGQPGAEEDDSRNLPERSDLERDNRRRNGRTKNKKKAFERTWPDPSNSKRMIARRARRQRLEKRCKRVVAAHEANDPATGEIWTWTATPIRLGAISGCSRVGNA